MTLGRRSASPAAPGPQAEVTVVSATRGVSLRFYARELWSRRDLVRVLVGRQLKSQYEMNVVGFGWWLLEPLTLTFVYVVVVDFIFNRGEPAYPLFVITALLPYKWLASSLVSAMNTVRGNASLVTDVYFPRALLPLVEVVVGMVHFLVGLVIIAAFMAIYTVSPTWHALWLPVVIAVQFLFVLSLAYPMSVWGLRFRNLPNFAGNLFRLWFYLSPGIWAAERFIDSPRLLTLVKLNPLTGLFVSYRNALLKGEPPDWELGVTLGIALVLLALGGRHFIRREAQFGKLL